MISLSQHFLAGKFFNKATFSLTTYSYFIASLTSLFIFQPIKKTIYKIISEAKPSH